MTVVDADDETAVKAMIDSNPVIVRGEGFRYDVFAMTGAFAR